MHYTDDNGVRKSLSVVTAVAAKWMNTGVALGFEYDILSSIELTRHGVAETCSLEIFSRWLSGAVSGSEVTWKTLIQVLSDLDYGALAQQLLTVCTGKH